jgi:hypothetical protein
MVIAMQISNALFKSLDRSFRKTSPVLELGGIGGQVLHYNILYSIKYFSIRDSPILLI